MSDIKKHDLIAKGYCDIYKGFEKIVKKYEKADELESALLYKKIANRFKEIHEKYLETVKKLKRNNK